MQFTQYSWITILQQQWVSIYDEMTSMDYKPLVSFENQFTGKTKLVLPFGIYLVNKERYVGVSFYILQKNGTEDLPVGKILFGTDEFPYGLYNLTIYQNNSDTNMDIDNTIKVVYNGLANITLSPVASDGSNVPYYKEYTTNDSDTESVYITN